MKTFLTPIHIKFKMLAVKIIFSSVLLLTFGMSGAYALAFTGDVGPSALNGAGSLSDNSPMRLFADVKSSDWAYKDIRKLADAEIVRGDEQPRRAAAANAASHNVFPAKPLFRPGDIMSREECAVILARLDGAMANSGDRIDAKHAAKDSRMAAPGQNFTDVPYDSWSYPYIETAKKYIAGYPARGGSLLFQPEEPMLRGEFISALIRLIDADTRFTDYSVLDAFADAGAVEYDAAPYIVAAIEKSILLGDDENNLRLSEPVVRREACALIVRALTGHMDFPDPRMPAIYVPDIDCGFYDAYFDDAVFVGDSITMGLRNYALSERARGNAILGGARFLCTGSYGLRAAAGDFNPSAVNLSYEGVEMALEDCLVKMDAGEVYLMLGMNDWAGASLPGSIEKYGVILDKIYAKNPDITVYIQFCTPITLSREAARLNNANTDKFNKAIVDLCAERGIDYVDVNAPMKDDDNALKREYASDGYVHLNASGCEAWIGALREFVKYNYVNGLWSAPAGAGPAKSYAGSYMETD